jgi:hypothetical protein
MKKTTIAIAALLATLSSATVVYADDTASTTAPTANCKPGDTNCKPDATTDGTAAPATDSTSAPASTEKDD